MNAEGAKLTAGLAILLSILLIAPALTDAAAAAPAGVTLSGTISAPAGTPVANSKISLKNLATGQSTETQTDVAGHYVIPDLAPGNYELSVSSDGFNTSTVQVTLAAGANKTLDVPLTTGLSLGDLGFTPSQTQGSAQLQARLNKRSHMLHIHQRLGLIATVPLIATLVTSVGAGGKSTSSADRDWHAALGSVTADLYFTSAYYAIFAPKIPGTKTRGPIRVHKILAWIHGPGMVLTPILGAMALDQKSKGEKIHGIASAHGAVAVVTAAAYGAAIISVSVRF